VIELERARLRIALPIGWSRVPGTDVAGWADEHVGDAGPAVVAALVAVAAAAVAAQPRSIAFVFLGDRPAVQAWAFLRLVPRRAEDAAAAADGAAATLAGPSSGGEVAVWHREVARTTVGAAPAVVLADLLTIDQGTVREVQRRVVVAWFPPEQVCLHLTVSTPSSTLFGDLVATAEELAAGVALREQP
jgi:hypothetical protein